MKTTDILIGGVVVLAVGFVAYQVFDKWSMNWMNSPEGQQKIGSWAQGVGKQLRQSNYANINIA